MGNKKTAGSTKPSLKRIGLISILAVAMVYWLGATPVFATGATNVASTVADGAYKAGNIIPITVTFDAVVNAVYEPKLVLNTTPVVRSAVYASGGGTNTLTFNYIVQTGDMSADLDVTAFDLSSGTINDASGPFTPAIPNSLAETRDIIIDTTAPTVTNVTSTVADTTYKLGATIPISIVFSEPVTVSGTAQLLLQTDSLDRYAICTSGTEINPLTFNYTVQAGDISFDLDYNATTSLSGTITDSAGNPAVLILPAPGAAGSLSNNKTLVVDGLIPTFTIQYYANDSLTTSLGNNPRLKAGTYYLKIHASEALSGPPTINIVSQGTANDVTDAMATLVSGNDYKYNRAISNDAVADGSILEDISITGTSSAHGNTATNVNPTDESSKAAYTDTIAPALSSAAVNGASLVLTYGEALDTASVPATSSFTVRVAGNQRTVSGIGINGSAVTLTLASAVTVGQAVYIDYAVPVSNPVRDTAGNSAAAITNNLVTNNTAADTTAPTLSSAAVNGAGLILTYNEALDPDSVPGTDSFTVNVNGSARTINSIAISGTTVSLALYPSVSGGQTVTVRYTMPTTSRVRDLAGNDAAAFTEREVTNNSPADITAPTLSSATVNGTNLVLSFSEALDTSSVPGAGVFEVKVNNSMVTISSVAVNGSAVTITLAGAVTGGQDVKVRYTRQGTVLIKDLAGNSAESFTDRQVTNNSTGDTTAPTLSTAVVSGASLVLTYNETLDTASKPGTAAFTVKVNGELRTVSSIAISGTTVALTLASPVTPGQTVTLDYAVPDTSPIQDAAGNDAAALSGRTVTNNTADDTTAPTLNSATVNGASLALIYNENLDSASVPVNTSFLVKVNGSTRDVSGVAVSGTTVTLTLTSPVTNGQTVLLDYLVPDTHPLQDAAGNDAAALTGRLVTNITPVANKTVILYIGNKYMVVNGASREIDPGRGTVPVVEKGRTLVPIRAIVEAVGGTIGWEEKTQKVTIILNNKTVELWIGKQTTRVNGITKTTDVAPKTIKGRTVLPVRFVTENLGCNVQWDEKTKRVTITLSNT